MDLCVDRVSSCKTPDSASCGSCEMRFSSHQPLSVLRYFQWLLRYFYRKAVLSYSPWLAFDRLMLDRLMPTSGFKRKRLCRKETKSPSTENSEELFCLCFFSAKGAALF